MWHEYLSENANLPPYLTYNYAISGSSISNHNYNVIPNLSEQINYYLLFNNTVDPFAAYFIWAGGNDFSDGIENPTEDNLTKIVKDTVKDLISSTNKLLQNGAESVIVFSIPDLALTPRALEKDQELNSSDFSKQLHIMSEIYQNLLEKEVASLQQQYPYKLITLVKALDIVNDLVNNGDQYGFKYFEGKRCNPNPLFSMELPVCNDPHNYVFWDEIHPTTYAHKILANKIYDILIDNGFAFDNSHRKLMYFANNIYDDIDGRNHQALQQLFAPKISRE